MLRRCPKLIPDGPATEGSAPRKPADLATWIEKRKKTRHTGFFAFSASLLQNVWTPYPPPGGDSMQNNGTHCKNVRVPWWWSGGDAAFLLQLRMDRPYAAEIRVSEVALVLPQARRLGRVVRPSQEGRHRQRQGRRAWGRTSATSLTLISAA